jgi:trehalose 6-phosphate phosphatase
MTRFGARCAYFLDIDGTLVDIAETPSTVKLNPALPRLIEALYRRSDGAVALITGRSIANADLLFPARCLPIAGQHGHERRSADGHLSQHPMSRHALDGARQAFADVVSQHPKLLLEDKGLSLALHYRRAPELATLAQRVVRGMQTRLGDKFCIHQGKHVVELTPAGRNKGVAIRAFMMEAPFRGRQPVFIGDDVTDEHGFAVVNRLGGHAIKVGPGSSVAGWRFENVRAVLKWLEHGKPEPLRNRRVTITTSAPPGRVRA